MRLLTPQIVLLVYYEVAVQWLPLYPWNDLARGGSPFPQDLIVASIMIGLMLWMARGSKWALRTGCFLYGLWLAVQLLNWWVPYMFGGTANEMYIQHFGRTHKFLPAIGDRPVPDSNHVVLQLLITWTLITVASRLMRGNAHTGSTMSR